MSIVEEVNEKHSPHGLGHGHLSIEQEDERLQQLGIRRELRKEFTNFSTISFALGILGSVPYSCMNTASWPTLALVQMLS